ncbi:hypothetical protein Dsin_027991 [Dipteronia sinensis]|uniref:DUF4283 domain-containing protein n=1 Tax=Dipteronia sinensis TaxID=43782 RepID=A0AAD9ZPQ9_9ROSI|nr:hypothetical protein Dsin_027991 [Dipteronia sinensis]
MMNSMHIYGWSIVSKVASYGWKKRRSLMSRKIKQVNEEGIAREGFQNDSTGSRSFVEGVKWHQRMSFGGGVKREEKKILIMEWCSQLNNHGWLNKVVVGFLNFFTEVLSVNSHLSSTGFNFSSSYIGDKSVIWSFDSDYEMEGVINNRFLWEDCFSSMVRWSESFIPKSRVAWINCSGIPLCYWNQIFFQKLRWLIGEPLLINEETLSRSRLDKGRLLVLIPNDQPYSCINKVVVGNGSFEVKVVEDGASVDVLWMEDFLSLKKKLVSGNLNLESKKEGFEKRTGKGRINEVKTINRVGMFKKMRCLIMVSEAGLKIGMRRLESKRLAWVFTRKVWEVTSLVDNAREREVKLRKWSGNLVVGQSKMVRSRLEWRCWGQVV